MRLPVVADFAIFYHETRAGTQTMADASYWPAPIAISSETKSLEDFV